MEKEGTMSTKGLFLNENKESKVLRNKGNVSLANKQWLISQIRMCTCHLHDISGV